MSEDLRPLVLHIVHRFDTGGLENGLANLINHMPAQAYRHAILALTEVT
ncbi:MAG: sugar transferase, partial [Rubrivivax sp.]|nr:sugar transferase [Rubrivivax sp.]